MDDTNHVAFRYRSFLKANEWSSPMDTCHTEGAAKALAVFESPVPPLASSTRCDTLHEAVWFTILSNYTWFKCIVRHLSITLQWICRYIWCITLTLFNNFTIRACVTWTITVTILQMQILISTKLTLLTYCPYSLFERLAFGHLQHLKSSLCIASLGTSEHKSPVFIISVALPTKSKHSSTILQVFGRTNRQALPYNMQ